MKNNKQGFLELIGAMLIFGTIGVFVKYIPLPSSVIALARGIIGVVFLGLVLLIKKQKLNTKAIRKNLLKLCVSGAFIGFNWIFLFEAYRYTTVATATLCYYLAPIFVIILSPFFLKEKLTLKKAICIVTALIGMVFVSGIIQNGVPKLTEIKGILFGIGAAVLYSLVIVINKRTKNVPSFDMTIVQLFSAAVVLLPYTLSTESFAEFSIDKTGLLLLAVVGIIHTGFAYSIYFASMQKLSAGTVAIFSYIDPIVAILISALFLKEPMGIYGIIGGALILGSAFISETKSEKYVKNLTKPLE